MVLAIESTRFDARAPGFVVARAARAVADVRVDVVERVDVVDAERGGTARGVRGETARRRDGGLRESRRGGRARGRRERARERAGGRERTAGSCRCARGWGGASGGASGVWRERRWTCHACERLEGGGRGPTCDGTIVQPANVPMVLLEVKGEVVERCALPMGKDDLVKGEMMTIGKWLARVVGVEGATPEKPRVLVRPPEAEDEASERAGGAVVAQHAVAQHAVAQHAPPLMIPTPSLATQPRAGGLEAPGARREYYREEHQQQQQQRIRRRRRRSLDTRFTNRRRDSSARSIPTRAPANGGWAAVGEGEGAETIVRAV